MTDEKRYARIHIWWESSGGKNFVTLHNRTEKEALEIAEDQGWKRPSWKRPWRYITNFGNFGMCKYEV